MSLQIQLRRGTAASWTSANPTLSQGEIGLETDTNKIKIGDGSTAWTSLSYGPYIPSVETIGGMIEVPTNKTFILDQYAPFAYTINSLVTKMVSGTCTAKLTIDGVDVTGIAALSSSSGEATANASAANTVAIGNTVALVISSVSSPVDFSFTVKVTRT